MASVTKEKQLKVGELKEKLRRAKAVVLADNKGLSVAQATKLRKELRDAGVEFRVAKNSLIRIAAMELGIEGLDRYLNGPTAVAFGYDDPVAPAKKLKDFFAKDRQPKLEIKAGLLEGKPLDLEAVTALADLPPKEVLVAQVIAGVQAPLIGVVMAVNGILSGVVYAIDARIRQLELAS